MSEPLGEKAMACLKMARISFGSAEYNALYQTACDKYSEKAVLVKFEQLATDGYIEYGVTARSGWLTEKGKAILRDDIS